MSGFEAEILLVEIRGRLREISQHLQEEHKLLREILERLPKPQTYHPTVGGTITVRN
jgi:hypothetical protein